MHACSHTQLEDQAERAEHGFKMLADEQARVEQLSVQINLFSAKDAIFNKEREQVRAMAIFILLYLSQSLMRSGARKISLHFQARSQLAKKDAEIAALISQILQPKDQAPAQHVRSLVRRRNIEFIIHLMPDKCIRQRISR